MNTFKYFICAIITVLSLAACSSDNEMTATDGNVIKINASIGKSLFTRTNPLATDQEEQKQFSNGDIINVLTGTGSLLYAKASAQYQYNGSSWSPLGGKYLVSPGSAYNYWGYYPVNDSTSMTLGMLTIDQSTLEGLQSADYMRASTNAKAQADNSVNLSFERTRTLIKVKIAGYGSELDPSTDKITNLTIFSPSSGYPNTNATNPDIMYKTRPIVPYIQDADGQYQPKGSEGGVGYCYTALIAPKYKEAEKLIELTLRHGNESKTMAVNFDCDFTNSVLYTIELIVGNDEVKVANVTVSDWAEQDITGGKAGTVLDVTGKTAEDLTDELLSQYCENNRLIVKGEFGTESEPYNNIGILAFAKIAGYIRNTANNVKYFDFSQTTGINSISNAVTYEDSNGKEQKANLSFYASYLVEANLPSTVTNISNAFAHCPQLKKVTGVDHIEPGDNNKNIQKAFYHCGSLTDWPYMPKVHVIDGQFDYTKSNESIIEVNDYTEIRKFGEIYASTVKLPAATTLRLNSLGYFYNLTDLYLTADAFDVVETKYYEINKIYHSPFKIHETKTGANSMKNECFDPTNVTLHLNATQKDKVTVTTDTEGNTTCAWKPIDSMEHPVYLTAFKQVICGDDIVYTRK